MYRIVVVDDEARQCRGLKNLLMRQYENLEAEAFTTAEAALAYIEKERVNLVITDICMPETDGLALTQKIKQRNIHARVILLTGFAEFEYARKAVELGAFDFLVKPLNPVKLKEVLDRAIQELEEESILAAQHEQMQKQLTMALPVYLEKLLNQWVYGWASEEEKAEVEQIIPANDSGFLLAVRLQGWNDWQAVLDKEAFCERKRQVTWWMREQLGSEYHSLSFFSHIVKDTMITIVTHAKTVKPYPNCMKQEQLIQTFPRFEQVEGLEELRVTIGVGELSRDLLHQIEACYKSAVDVLTYGYYFPMSHLLYASYLLPRRIERVMISLAEEEWVKSALKTGETKEAVEALHAILERCLLSGYPEPVHLMNACENLLRHAALSLRSELLITMEHLPSYEQFMQQADQILEMLAEEVQMKKSGRNSEFAVKFEVYLQEHYQSDVTLDEIAAYFGLTPAYCSALVKEITGSSFSKGLITIRMQKAKELLETTSLRIYEIAVETGYNDVKYFNRVFKKETGLTPIQYREEVKEIKEGGDA